MGSALSRRLARLEQRVAAQHPAPCPVRFMASSPEEQEAVLRILLEAGALRLADDGSVLCLTEGGYVPWLDWPQ
jgi:hypothetical protein